MKKFHLKASLLAGLSHVVSQLKPEQKASAAANPVEGNRIVDKAAEDVEKANDEFMQATKETSDKLKERFEALKKEADETAPQGSPEWSAACAKKTDEFRKESEVINAASKAEPEKVIEVVISDDKLEALKAVFPLTVNQWQDSKAFVETADALSAAEDV